MADLILTNPAPAPKAPESTPARRCACERVQRYGIEMCRWCAWRLLTPPPLPAAPFKAQSPRNEERSYVGLGGCGAVESAKAAARARRNREARDRAKVLALRG